VVLVERLADDLPDINHVKTVEASHCVILLDLDSIASGVSTGNIEIRLEPSDSHACHRLVSQASEDVNNILAAIIMFVPVGRLHFETG
jgi:hypothetical protein